MPLSSTSTATRRRFFHVAAVKTTLLSALLLANSPLSAAADGRDADRRAKCSGCSRQASVRLLGPGASGPLALVPFDPEGTSVVDDEIASVRYFPEYEASGHQRIAPLHSTTNIVPPTSVPFRDSPVPLQAVTFDSSCPSSVVACRRGCHRLSESRTLPAIRSIWSRGEWAEGRGGVLPARDVTKAGRRL